jgi:poly-beta-1,6-N-acetyl-D-glucosamine synthase
MKNKYVLITPIKDEIDNFKKCSASVVNQTVKPDKWIIIDDGSIDGTKDLVNDLQKKCNWITALHNPPREERRPGGEFILKKAFDLINIKDYDFIVKMDGDLTFSEDFFSSIFRKFEEEPKLGVASGSCYIIKDGEMVEETKARVHTRGPMKVYKSKCFEEIGGIVPSLGWDTIDEIKAQQLGWKTKTFPELEIIHLRPTQSAKGKINGFRNMAKASYYIGYHPLYMIARGVVRMKEEPYVIGGMAMIVEFFKNYIEHKPQIEDKELIKFIRKQQLDRLKGKESDWR